MCKEVEDTIVNELHFGREAERELEEQMKCVDWKRKKEDERGKEVKEEFALMRWLETLKIYFLSCRLQNEENVELINSIVQIYRAAKGNNGVISNQCILSLIIASVYGDTKIEDLLKGGAIDVILEEMQRPTLNEGMTNECLLFFTNVSIKLKEKNKDVKEEAERKATKKEIFEKMEEEGYEDTITSFYETLNILNTRPYHTLLLNISDYLVNAL